MKQFRPSPDFRLLRPRPAPVLALGLLTTMLLLMPGSRLRAQGAGENTHNPIIWADVPDPSVVRVGDAYYMSSTTMHMSPGVPIMKSTNLVDWKIVSYAYDTLANTDALALRNGQSAYGRGSWASSIRYHDGTFYVVTFSYTTDRTYIFTTDDVEHGTWQRTELSSVYHDPGLFFDDDGRVYLLYGSTDIRIIELTEDASAVKPGGLNRTIIPNAGQIAGSSFYVAAEGSHLHKVDGRYYLFLITWPQGSGRTELVYRADDLASPWEGRVALSDDGIAQGGIVDTPEGDWYALLFQDHGAVGRIPYLVPVTWEDGWPLFGVERAFGGGRDVPTMLDIPTDGTGVSGIVASDEFDYGAGEPLALEWQWNHNPDNQGWSVAVRPGYLRLMNGRIDPSFVATRNTLTQRTFGPQSAAKVAIHVSEMKNGDYAGLGLLQEDFGFIGVKMSGSSRSIVMVNGSSETPVEVASMPIDQNVVYLGVEVDYRSRADRASFYYSIDGEQWTKIGNTLSMSYELSHFMGYRFALFNYATESTGGFVDFDYFRLGDALDNIVSTNTGDAGTIPTGLDLGANYPNPFRAKTEIGYRLAGTSDVRIDVYDMTGRHLRPLVDGIQAPGRHTVIFDASGLPSGIYLYRMQAGGYQATGRMTVVR